MIDNKKLEELRKNGWSWHPASGGSGKYAQPEWGHEVSNGMVEVLPEMTFDYRGEALVELFDTPFPEPLMVGKTYRVTWNGKTVDCIAYEVTGEDGYIGLGRNTFSEGEEPFGIHVFNDVRYGKYYWEAEGHDGIYPVTVHITTEDQIKVYHKIPGEYVGGVGKYKQPEWGAETDIVDILPGIMIDGEEQMPIMKQFTLIDGKEYIVNWNAKDYTCKATTIAGDVVMIMLGNVGALTGGEDTGEPFVVANLMPADAASMGMYGMAMAFDGSTSATLFIKGEGEVVYPIPTKYLENVMRVTCFATSDDITSDKTFAEIKDAIVNGVYVYAISSLGDNTIIYQLTEVTNTHIIFYQVETKTRLMVSNDNHWSVTDLS